MEGAKWWKVIEWRVFQLGQGTTNKPVARDRVSVMLMVMAGIVMRLKVSKLTIFFLFSKSLTFIIISHMETTVMSFIYVLFSIENSLAVKIYKEYKCTQITES